MNLSYAGLVWGEVDGTPVIVWVCDGGKGQTVSTPMHPIAARGIAKQLTSMAETLERVTGKKK